MRASTLATFEDVSTIPETVSPPRKVVALSCTSIISGFASGGSTATAAGAEEGAAGLGIAGWTGAFAAIGAIVTGGSDGASVGTPGREVSTLGDGDGDGEAGVGVTVTTWVGTAGLDVRAAAGTAVDGA
jgi:hypothetical protein